MALSESTSLSGERDCRADYDGIDQDGDVSRTRIVILSRREYAVSF